MSGTCRGNAKTLMKGNVMHIRFVLLSALILMIMYAPSAHGIEPLRIDGEISSLKVLEAVHGKLSSKDGVPIEPAIWHNIEVPDGLKTYWSEKDGEVYVAFESRYMENKAEKYILVTQTRPYGKPDYQCHACAPLIGCVVFVKSDSSWVLENENKYIGVIGKWGWMHEQTIDPDEEDAVKLVKVAAERHGILIRGDDMHNGYENHYFYLLYPYKGGVKVALSDWIEGPSASACPDVAARNKQGISVIFDNNGKSDYYDLSVTKEWNEGICGKVKSVKKTIVYEFIGGAYKKK